MAPMIRAAACLSLAGLLALPVSGWAQDAPRRGGEIRVATYSDPGTLDPHITTDVPALRIRNQVCETLITWDAQTKESPMLADSWENSADGTVWTFKLRRGVKFHGGQTLRAADVKYSFERILKVWPRKTDYHIIKEIKTPDDATVQFVLSTRTSAFFPARPPQGE
jgi:peptide/nickel transport system substrate-binding protein